MNENRGNEICKGRTAVIGCVDGYARVVDEPNGLTEIKENEILVTFMTTPDSVPAMIKAKAVVTDRGGVLCHAAIVCRELKKPCVVGATGCMEKIHTGDYIIVNATEGIVYHGKIG